MASRELHHDSYDVDAEQIAQEVNDYIASIEAAKTTGSTVAEKPSAFSMDELTDAIASPKAPRPTPEQAYWMFMHNEEYRVQEDFKRAWAASHQSMLPYDLFPTIHKSRQDAIREALWKMPLKEAGLRWADYVGVKSACKHRATFAEVSAIKKLVRAQRYQLEVKKFLRQKEHEKVENMIKKRYDPTHLMIAWNPLTHDTLKSMWAQKNVEGLLDAQLQFFTAEMLTRYELNTFALIVLETSSKDYKVSKKELTMSAKAEELSDPAMMFLAVRAPLGTDYTFPGLQTNILAYIAFRLDNDEPPHEEQTLMYIWEIHVSENWRGSGIGKFLIDAIECIANSAGITKSMLTVLNCNKAAAAVYTKLGYIKDAASPRRARYTLMSKEWPSTTADPSEEHPENNIETVEENLLSLAFRPKN